MDQAPGPRAQSRSEAAADRDRAVDGADAFAAKNIQRGRCDQGASRTDHAAEGDDKTRQQPVARIILQQPEQDDADDRDAVAEQHGWPAADDAVQRRYPEHAEQQYHAGKAPCGGGLQGRKSGIDQIGDDLRRDRVHRDGREKESREQRPKGVVKYRTLQGPAIIDEAGVGFLRHMRRAGGEHPPG